MSSYREKHYYTSQIPLATACCGGTCGSSGTSSATIAVIESKLDKLDEMLGNTVEFQSLGGVKLATVFTKD